MKDKLALEAKLTSLFAEASLNVPVTPFIHYLELLVTWNQAYNLTAIRAPEAMLSKHLLDSLAIMPWVEGHRVLDVGTGPGLPGIPLAIARPEVKVTLLDSNGKKIRFLREVIRQLALQNVEVIESRVENYKPQALFETVTSRAFSSTLDMIQKTRHLLMQGGTWLLMKGQVPEAELKALDASCDDVTYQIKSYTVPEVVGARCCVLIKPKG